MNSLYVKQLQTLSMDTTALTQKEDFTVREIQQYHLRKIEFRVQWVLLQEPQEHTGSCSACVNLVSMLFVM